MWRAKAQAQTKFWDIYQRLKKYRTNPTPCRRNTIETRFDSLCLTKTTYPDLNAVLGLLHAKRNQFLTVLDYPHLPLHNNLSENDIREYARLRKISGGTRSDLGSRCRDTFISLKKTCRKLGVSFRAYLHDRLNQANRIPPLTALMRASAKQNPTPLATPLTC